MVKYFKLPNTNHKQKPYSGPPSEVVANLRKFYLTPSLLILLSESNYDR